MSRHPGTTSFDLYYDVEGDISYTYDIFIDVLGTGSISNVGGGDSDLGNTVGSGWEQFGGDISGEIGNTVLGFSFDFMGDLGSSLLVSGTYIDMNFSESPITSSTLVEVSAVPVPAAIWLFGSGLIGFIGMRKRYQK